MSAWDDARAAKVGTIFYDEQSEGIRLLVLRGPASVNAYLGVPEQHPLAAIDDYNGLPLNVHGGLTYARRGEGMFPTGWMWWGWDYAHSGDEPMYDSILHGHRWTPNEVLEEAWAAVDDLRVLVKMAERIAMSERRRVTA